MPNSHVTRWVDKHVIAAKFLPYVITVHPTHQTIIHTSSIEGHVKVDNSYTMLEIFVQSEPSATSSSLRIHASERNQVEAHYYY